MNQVGWGSEGAHILQQGDNDNQDMLATRRLALLMQNLPLALVANVTAAVIAAAVQSQAVASVIVGVWFSALMLVSLLRYLLLSLYRRDSEEKHQRKFQLWFEFGTLLSGIVWGSAGVLLFPADFSEYQVFLAFVLGGVAIGSVLSLNPAPRLAMLFVALTLVPITFRFLADLTSISVAEGVLGIAFLALVLRVAQLFGRNSESLLRMELEHEQQTRAAVRDREVLRLVLENIPARVFWKGKDLRYLGGNELFKRDAGLSEGSTIVGMSDDEMPWHSRTGEFVRAEKEIIEKRQGKLNYQEFSRQLNGDPRWLEVSKVPIINERDEVEGVLGIYHDITPRKKAEEALRLAATAFETHEAITITDAMGRIISVNRAFTEVTGYTQAEVLGRNPNMLSSGKHDAHFYQAMWRDLINAGRWSGEVINKRKNGREYAENLTITAVRDGEGKVVNYVGVFSDISEKKEMERQLRHSQKMEAIGTLVGGIAHEFNNMLVGISGNIFLAQESLDPATPAYEMLETADNISFKAAEMVRQLLTLARKDNATQRLLPIDLNKWLDEGLKLARSAIPATVDLAVEKRPLELMVNADTTQLQQILINLLNNARDASLHREQPRIEVELSAGEASSIFRQRHPEFPAYEYVRLSVRDNGTGIPVDKLEKIFEPFYTTKEVGKGTGLGLAVIQALTHSHRGALELESVEGEGTAFHLYFPKLRPEELQETARSEEYAVVRGQGETILVADDEAGVLRTTSMLLQGLGYCVLEASDGAEALARFEEGPHKIDLLLLDVVMPQISGPQAALRMRAIRPQIPLLFYTGYSREEMIDELREQGNYKMIAKPARIGELSHMIRNLLDE